MLLAVPTELLIIIGVGVFIVIVIIAILFVLTRAQSTINNRSSLPKSDEAPPKDNSTTKP